MSEREKERLHHHYWAMISSCRASHLRLFDSEYMSMSSCMGICEWITDRMCLHGVTDPPSVIHKTWTHSSVTHVIVSVPDSISFCFYVRSLTPSLFFMTRKWVNCGTNQCIDLMLCRTDRLLPSLSLSFFSLLRFTLFPSYSWSCTLSGVKWKSRLEEKANNRHRRGRERKSKTMRNFDALFTLSFLFPWVLTSWKQMFP